MSSFAKCVNQLVMPKLFWGNAVSCFCRFPVKSRKNGASSKTNASSIGMRKSQCAPGPDSPPSTWVLAFQPPQLWPTKNEYITHIESILCEPVCLSVFREPSFRLYFVNLNNLVYIWCSLETNLRRISDSDCSLHNRALWKTSELLHQNRSRQPNGPVECQECKFVQIGDPWWLPCKTIQNGILRCPKALEIKGELCQDFD